MTHAEAQDFAARMRSLSTVVLEATVERILPSDLDPVIEGDDGWDVRVEVINNEQV